MIARDGKNLENVVSPVRIPHLDGIRGLALLGVLLYHFDIPGAHGGFSGVDVFLVLSGFLMTRILVSDISKGEFSFRLFMWRRFWRLYPCLVVTVFATLVFSLLIFTPEKFVAAAKSAIAALLFSSNYHFMGGVGYWDPGSTTKPLLHTWSLSLEEQFYLAWPPFLLFVMRFQNRTSAVPIVRLYGSILVMCASSFLLGVALIPRFPVQAFFTLPFRAFEFGVGALLVFLWERESVFSQPKFREMAGWVGITLVLGSFFFLPPGTSFPGFASLPCLIGSAALLMADNTFISRSILENPLSMKAGRMSYSAYLVHWPVVVFGHELNAIYGVSKWFTWLIYFVSTWFWTVCLHEVVEKPVRSAKSKPKISTFLFIFVTFVFATFGIASSLPFRTKLKSGTIGRCFDPGAQFPRKTCIIGNSSIEGGLNDTSMILIGDSFAGHLLSAFSTIAVERNVSLLVTTVANCPLRMPTKNWKRIINKSQRTKTWPSSKSKAAFQARCTLENALRWNLVQSQLLNTSVLIASPFIGQSENDLVRLADGVGAAGNRLIIIGPPPGTARGYPTGKCHANMHIPLPRLLSKLSGRNECRSYGPPPVRYVSTRKRVMNAGKIAHIPIIDLGAAFCKQAYRGECLEVLEGVPLYNIHDGRHLSPTGTRFVTSALDKGLQKLGIATGKREVGL